MSEALSVLFWLFSDFVIGQKKIDTTGKVRKCFFQWMENFKFSKLDGSPHYAILGHKLRSIVYIATQLIMMGNYGNRPMIVLVFLYMYLVIAAM
jgi:hypothetical protein